MSLPRLIFVFLFACVRLSAQQDSIADPLQSYILSLSNKVETEDKLIGNMNPDSAANLPFGIVKEIGATRYIICIDSAKYVSNAATMSAYMAMEFPGSQQKICFSAQNIAFNPKGVMPGPNTRLVLVSEHRISLGPKITMVLKPDGYNYVEWDCNGFSAVNLKGYFEFDPGMIYPDPENFIPDSIVRATFQIHTNDIHNMVVQTSMAPFCVRGMDGVSFTVTDATADFSELANAPNMAFPQGYNLSNYGDPLMWTGFYMRNFIVKLPKELSKNGQRPTIAATNLLIDQSGVSGLFMGSNLFSLSQGSMSGWGFSVQAISVNIVSNHINGATMAGYIRLPVSEIDSLAYACAISQNNSTGSLDYVFAITPNNNIRTEVIGGTLTLYNTSSVQVIKQNGKFRPTATLNGKYSLATSNAQVKNLEFQNMVLASDAPILRSATFALVSENPDSNKMAGFQFNINAIQFGLYGNEPAISFNVGVNFSDGNALSIGADAGFIVKTSTATVANPAEGLGATKPKMQFDGVSINNIALDFHTGPFSLDGLIQFRENDPIYGKGFNGNITFTIDKVMNAPAQASVWFGRVNNMRYFYVDAAIPITVPIGTNVAIYRFMGGIYYHMSRASNAPLESQLYSNAFGNANQYTPNSNIGLGIKAGVTIGSYPLEKPCNGDVALEIAFNASGGMSYINFTGNVFFMTGINQRMNVNPNNVPVVASIVMNYDFQNDALHAALGAQVHFPGVNGSGQASLHFEPGLWYIHIGRPQNRVTLSVLNLATITAYFETGQLIDPMPPPPPQVTSVVNMNGLNDQRDENALTAGGGLCFGASFNAGKSDSFGLTNNIDVYYSFGIGAGFDIMVLNYGPNAHCQNSSAVVGINGWYSTGQIYAYLQGAIGLEGQVANQNFNVTILSLSAAAILQARLPNPTWVGGSVGCDYDILGGIVSGHVDCAFQLGNQCTIVQP
jgi:hypothetical protein